MTSVTDHAHRDDTVGAIGYMLLAVFFLSTMDVAIKQLVTAYPTMQVVFLRCALSAPFFATWILLRNRKLFRPVHFKWHLLRAAIGVLMLFAVGECLRELPLADAYAIFFAAPLLITLLSGPLMKEPAGPLRIGAAVTGFAGVLVILQPGGGSWLSYGAVMALAAVICYAFTALLLRALGRAEHSLTIVLWFTTLVGLASAAAAWPQWQGLQWAHWPWILTLGVTGTLGQLTLTEAFTRASAAVVAPYDYLHMIWAMLYGWWFWGELPVMRTWLGAGVIVASGLYILHRERVVQSGTRSHEPAAD